jgi:hypothetical protein
LPAALLTLQFRTGNIHYAFVSATGEPLSVGISSRVLRQLSECCVLWGERLCPHTDCNVQFRTVQHKRHFRQRTGRLCKLERIGAHRRTRTSIDLDASQSIVIISVSSS